MTLDRAEIEERQLTLNAAALAEIEAAKANGELEQGANSRCYVCCEDESLQLVNKLIAVGLTNREIVETCEAINERRREVGDTRIIGPKSVRAHTRFHFNIQKPAQAAYRKIIERRAEEANLDYINGVGHSVTPYAVLETAMLKGFERIVAEDSTVTVREAMDAASRLYDMSARDASQRKMADLIYSLDRIVRAAQEFVPEELWESFVDRAEGRPNTPMIEAAQPHTVREFIPARHSDGDEFE
jgi:hypothetical protein